MSNQETDKAFDVLIVGAGLSGIGAAVHLRKRCPDRSFAILEGRAASGGTWDLFRYPGVRSDSDMYTLGYEFKPWLAAKSIADGPAILSYIRETATEHGLDAHIRYQHKVVSAAWSSADALWTVDILQGPDAAAMHMRCKFLLMCSGYYRYDQGYLPDFEGMADFKGQIVHPQHWTPDVQWAGKRVVVIGSGATAVTLLPELAQTAGHVTLLQRSPTYMVSRPAVDPVAVWLNGHLPAKLSYALTRWKNVLMGMFFYRLAKAKPTAFAGKLIEGVRHELAPGFDVEKHFTPAYKPWDQRLCLVPHGDLFQSIREGKASVVTEHIDRFTPEGILLKNGQRLNADLIVTATGLDLQALGGMALTVDGKPVQPKDCLGYKGMMLSGVPNLANVFGYTNASWTLKSDLTSKYVCRLLNHMTQTGARHCTPTLSDASVKPERWVDFSSGYIQRSLDRFPQQGDKSPWRLHQNYILDLLSLKYGRLNDGALVFSR